MLAKNGFGGFGKTLEGPRLARLGKTATANYAGESITIECW